VKERQASDRFHSVRATSTLHEIATERSCSDRRTRWSPIRCASPSGWKTGQGPTGADLDCAAEASGGWRKLTYAEGFDRVRALGQALLERGVSVERPLAILSDNDIEHALLAAAALHVGVPFAAISPAYSLVAKDFFRLRHVIDILTPGLVFAADGTRFSDAIRAAIPERTPLLVTRAPLAGYTNTLFHDFEHAAATAAVDYARTRRRR
jgi:acyl-CoA synthetase (AMP-forming)/AMP-acid ligase II